MSVIHYCPNGEAIAHEGIPLLVHFRELKQVIEGLARAA